MKTPSISPDQGPLPSENHGRARPDQPAFQTLLEQLEVSTQALARVEDGVEDAASLGVAMESARRVLGETARVSAALIEAYRQQQLQKESKP